MAEKDASSLIDSSTNRQFTVEEALNEIGLGRFQYILLILTGLTWVADIMEIVLLAFLAPAVKCAWDLSTTQVSLLSAIVFLGMGIGSYLAGTISDSFGRKVGAFFCFIILSTSGIITTFVPNYTTLLIARGIVGIGIGGMNSMLSMFAEFLPQKNRGQMLVLYQSFAAVGISIEVVLAWVLLPSFGWRGLVLASASVPVLLLFLLPWVSESPRYLVVMGQKQKAIRVLHRVAYINGSICPTGELSASHTETYSELTVPQKMKKQILELFEYPLDRVTPLLWVMWFLAAFSSYSLLILITTIQSDDNDDDCKDEKLHLKDSDFLGFFLSSFVELVILIPSAFVIDKIDRRKIYLAALWLQAIALFPMLFDPPAKVVFFYIARPGGGLAFLAVNILTAEIYPSSCRASAISFANVASRIGGGTAPLIALHLYDWFGLTLTSSVLCFFCFLGGILSLYFPFNTLGKPMVEKVQDIITNIAPHQYQPIAQSSS